MAGVKGTGGPLPKRSDQRRRTNTPAAGEPRKAPAGAKPKAPPVASSWHPIAKRWFKSLSASGQSQFYEESDWATAYVLAESMSRELKPQPVVAGDSIEMLNLPPKAASLAAWLKGAGSLLATEGDRRRAALELQRQKPLGTEEGGDVTHLDDVRSRLRGAG